MLHGDFIWCDLSAYDPQVAMNFYTGLLGWSWSDDAGTHLASIGYDPVASVYQMPQKFIDMGMPSFWMSYIAVNSAAKAAEVAEAQGGKVELGPAEFQPGSRYALIRDPLGAGFTVIDTPPQAGATKGQGARMGHALFVSDVQAVAGFYNALFGWAFQPAEGGVYAVHHRDELLFHCHEIPDPAIRGKEQYWTVLFANDNGRSAVESHGGHVLAEFDIPEGRAILGVDPQQAAFMTVRPHT